MAIHANRVIIESIEHVQVAIPVGGEALARDFYAGFLGLIEVPKPEAAGRGGAWFESGPAKVHIGIEADFRPAKKAHPAFVVADVDSLEARCRSAGHEVVRGSDLPGFKRVFVYDPFGNRLEFMQANEHAA